MSLENLADNCSGAYTKAKNFTREHRGFTASTLFFHLFNYTDYLSTKVHVENFSMEDEGNPLIEHILQETGSEGLLALKAGISLAATPIMYLLYTQYREEGKNKASLALPVFGAGLYCTLTVSNTLQLFLMNYFSG